MIKEKQRREIMEACPDDFKEELESFIDDIESALKDIAENISEAHRLSDELLDSIY